MWSLEHRLPVLISLLLACVVGGLSFAAYREVRATAISRATDRLDRVGRELLTSAARSTAVRAESLHAVAADPIVARASIGSATPAEVAGRLAASHEPLDTTLVGWHVGGVRRGSNYSSAAGWSPTDSVELAKILDAVVQGAEDRRSPFYRVGDAVHSWVAVPVLAGGRPVGTVAELRRVGDNSGADAAIRGLVDDDARLLFTSRGSAQWLSLRGKPIAAPFARPEVEGRTVRVDANAEPVYVVQHAVPGTPWLMVLFQPQSSVLRRPHEFLRTLLGVGGLILAVATVGAWLLGRIVTRPLRDVTEASAALAQGDYGRRVSVSGGGREVASLSATFNAMATAIGDAHATLADRNAELHRANAAKAQFLAMMSHELRTPLNAIGGFTELIELGLRGPVTPEQVEDLARIRRNKDLLLSIITDILDFARADAGTLTLRLDRVVVAPLIAEVVDAVRLQSGEKGLHLTLGPVPEDAVVRGDREKIHQVLLNLVSNAMKFTPGGGTVGVVTVVEHGVVRIEVSDTGPGIGADQLDAIFEPFVQLDASLTRRAGGTGLGLAIARQLTAAMGGTVAVRSTVGEGSTFSLTLPHADRAEPVIGLSSLASGVVGQIA